MSVLITFRVDEAKLCLGGLVYSMHVQRMIVSASAGFIGTRPHRESRKICILIYDHICQLLSTNCFRYCSNCVKISFHAFLYHNPVR